MRSPPTVRVLEFLIWTAVVVCSTYSQDMVLSKKTTVHTSPPDTSTTIFQYDRNGFVVRTVSRDSFIQEWDHLGRYAGYRVQGDTNYIEKTTWFSEDSAQRRNPVFDEPLG